MKKDDIAKVLDELTTLKLYRINEGKIPQGVWFLFETIPTPDVSDCQQVIADIVNEREINVSPHGQVRHRLDCQSADHSIDSALQKALKKIKSQKYTVALWEGRDLVYDGQPLAIVLYPPINYDVYPDHLHLNPRRIDPITGYFIPDSICYTSNPKGLGEGSHIRIREAFIDICTWLFRHEVWLATREIDSPIWIGPQHISLDYNINKSFILNPFGLCYCGSGKLYHKCHMEGEVSEFYKQHGIPYDFDKHVYNWQHKSLLPQISGMTSLKQYMK